MHWGAFDDKSHIAEQVISDMFAQIINERTARDIARNRFVAKVKFLEIIQSVLAVIAAKYEERVLIDDSNVAETLAGRLPSCARSRRHTLLLYGAPRASLEVQLVKVIHSAPSRSTEDVHALSVRNGNVAVARLWWGARNSKRTPAARLQVEQVHIVQMVRAIVPTKQAHAAARHNTRSTVSCAWRLTRCRDHAPRGFLKVELMEVVLVGAIVAAEAEHRVLVHNSRV